MGQRSAIVIFLLAVTSAYAVHADPACTALGALKLHDTVIEEAQAIAAAPYHPPGMDGAPAIELPAHCRVAGTIRPTPDSAIGFEVWMPTDHWNQRYRQAGGGGLGGFIAYGDLAGHLKAGYATASTDDGHRTNGNFDALWAVGHPAKLIDYGSRAVHQTALVAQAIVAAYYRQKPRYRYFVGCSNGGRESLMEAQRYPTDFDGYLAGSPGIDIPNNGIAHLHLAKTLAALGPAGQLSALQLKSLSMRVLERCDADDGIKDGILRDPRQCVFSARELICRGPSDGSCLTAEQASAAQSIYDGLKDPHTHEQLSPGWIGTLGSEDISWPQTVPFLAELLASQNYLNLLLYGQNETDLLALDLVKAARDIKHSLAPIINADNPDLRIARDANKKILQFHGWPDNAVLPQYSVNYFEAVQKFLGSSTARFYRLFMVPGMAHCGGGVGPTIYASGLSPDPWHEWMTALETWVETGTAPDRIIATEYDTSNLSLGPFRNVGVIPTGTPIKRTRPLCPYPTVAVYTGHGSWKQWYPWMLAPLKPFSNVNPRDSNLGPPISKEYPFAAATESYIAAPNNHYVRYQDDHVIFMQVCGRPTQRENIHGHAYPSVFALDALFSFKESGVISPALLQLQSGSNVSDKQNIPGMNHAPRNGHDDWKLDPNGPNGYIGSGLCAAPTGRKWPVCQTMDLQWPHAGGGDSAGCFHRIEFKRIDGDGIRTHWKEWYPWMANLAVQYKDGKAK